MLRNPHWHVPQPHGPSGWSVLGLYGSGLFALALLAYTSGWPAGIFGVVIAAEFWAAGLMHERYTTWR